MTQPPSTWISAEEWAPGEFDPTCDAVDVVVTLPEGTRWGATVLTPSYMAQVRRTSRESGECLGGRYFWLAWPIFTDDLSRPTIEAIVADLLASGEFPAAFQPLGAETSEPAI